jgi:hypothetical protein
MLVSKIQSLAITARMAAIVGSDTFDRLFAGVEFNEVDGEILFVYAQSEDCAAEMEDRFALNISIAAEIPRRASAIFLKKRPIRQMVSLSGKRLSGATSGWPGRATSRGKGMPSTPKK